MGFSALVKGSNEYWKLTLPFLRGSVHRIQGCPLGHLGVRSSNLYPQSVSSKGWKPALLGIRVERPVTEVPWISAQVWLVFPPKGGRGSLQRWHRNYQGAFLGNWKVENLCMTKVD